MTSLGQPIYSLQGINCGRRPITTIMPFIFVIRTGERIYEWRVLEFWKVRHMCVHLGDPGACSTRKNFKILDARITLVAIFVSLIQLSTKLAIHYHMHKL